MAGIEGAIRPFIDQGVEPTAFRQPGTVGVPDVHVWVGKRGGTKTFSFSGSAAQGTFMGEAKREKAPNSPALQNLLSTAAGNN